MIGVMEDVATALRDWLIEKLPDRLVAMETDYGGAVRLPMPGTVVVSDQTPYQWAEYPVVMVTFSRAEFEDLSMGLQEYRGTYAIVVAVSAGNPDEGMPITLRYAEAIRGLLRDDMTIGGAVDRGRITAIEYVPAMPEDIKVHVAVLTAMLVKSIPG